MTMLSPIAVALAGALAAVWLVAAVWAVRTGLAMQRGARAERDRNEAMAALIAASPAVAVIVRPDGRLEAPDRVAPWLGLDSPPAFLSDLTGEDGGLQPADAAALAEEVAAAQRSARSFALPVRARGSSRSLLVRGSPEAKGRVTLWIFDATESQSEIESLRKQISEYREALDALSGMIEAAPLPIWFRDRAGRLQMVNSHYVAAVGGQDAAAVIAGGFELVEAADGQSAGEVAARAAHDGQALRRILPVTIGTSRRMMSVSDVPLGELGVAGYAIDLQEEESLRTALRKQAQAQRDMLDRLSAGVAQFGPDRRLSFCNQPFISIFALTPDMVAPETEFDRLLDAMRNQGTLPEARDFPAWRRERAAWFLSEAPQEENWLLRDGVHVRVVAQPLPDGGLLLIFEDRTEQVRLSSAHDTLLRVRAATFDNLFESIAVFSADGRLHLWNSRFRALWRVDEETLAAHPRVDELVGQIADRLDKPQQASLVRQLIRAATVERRQRGGRIAFADGRHFEFAAIPLPDGNALFVMLDVTDSRRMERALRDRNQALEEADRVKTAFVANMSYELRTPLTSIAGFAEMMMAGYAGTLTDRTREYVGAIMTSTERLTKLIDNVLDLTQGAAGMLPVDKQDIAASEIADAALRRHADSARATGITLVRDVLPSAGRMQGDARRLGQALDHLLDNAIRYTGKGGRVLLHADGTQERVRFIVSDDGPGMDAETQARLFDVFARFSHAASGEADGLGLLIVRRMTEAHGGTVSILSEPGQGTVITMDMPRA